MDCLFCKIIKGEIPSYKIYEDEHVFVFLDIKPLTKGHALVIPKKHSQDIFDIAGEDLEKVVGVAQKVSQKIRDSLKAGGIRLSQSNGVAAGQEVMHFHLHVIPRYNNDGVSNNPTLTAHVEMADLGDLAQLAEQIKL